LASMRRIGAAIGWGLLALLILFPIGLWSTLALWFRTPGPEWVRALAAAAFGLLALATIAAPFFGRRLRMLGCFALAFGAILVWWSTIQPKAVANWATDVSRQATGVVSGDMLEMTDVRDFDWATRTEFTEKWVAESYDLSKLRDLDLILAYWAGPEMTHVIMSFGFEDGRHLAWSVEVRALKGGEFSPIADLFRNSPLVIIASEERDVVRLRTNVRKEDVQLYRLRVTPATARAILLEYVEKSNGLAVKPRFYNSIITNCSTAVVALVRAAGATLPLDWRLVVNGFLPSYLYDHGAVDTSIPLEELRERSRISARAIAADGSPDFSRLIRVGVPVPAPR